MIDIMILNVFEIKRGHQQLLTFTLLQLTTLMRQF